MSRPRVITGTDERGRPKAEWADPEPDVARGYGHMEPAIAGTVERRKATPEEMAAARAREAEPRHLTVASLGKPVGLRSSLGDQARMQASRQRGAERHVEVVAGGRAAAVRRPSPAIEEEAAVSEPTKDYSETIPGAVVVGPAPSLEPRADTLAVLADAVGAAAEAWADALRCEHLADEATVRWAQARAALDAAYRALDNPPAAPEPEEDVDHEAATANLIRALRDADAGAKAARADAAPEPIGGGPARSRSGEGQRHGQASARDRRAAAVMSAMGRLDDDMGAVAAELGMKKNAVAQIVKFARQRAGAEA